VPRWHPDPGGTPRPGNGTSAHAEPPSPVEPEARGGHEGPGHPVPVLDDRAGLIHVGPDRSDVGERRAGHGGEPGLLHDGAENDSPCLAAALGLELRRPCGGPAPRGRRRPWMPREPLHCDRERRLAYGQDARIRGALTDALASCLAWAGRSAIPIQGASLPPIVCSGASGAVAHPLCDASLLRRLRPLGGDDHPMNEHIGGGTPGLLRGAVLDGYAQGVASLVRKRMKRRLAPHDPAGERVHHNAQKESELITTRPHGHEE
jgi:hypothetical protein